jgi:type VI secretion system protein ImpG
VLGHHTSGAANELNRFHPEGATALREVLELYDWSPDDGAAQRIDAIREVRVSLRQVLARGGMLREIRLHVELDASAFDGPGDAVLFGDVLNHFLGRYAGVHHAVGLALVVDGKETVYPRTMFEGAPF